MRFFLNIAGIALFSLVLEWFLPFWAAVMVCFIAGLLTISKKAFLTGFLGIFLLWAGYLFFINWQNDFILLNRFAQILPVKFPALLILINALIGGLLGGLGSLSGFLLRRL